MNEKRLTARAFEGMGNTAKDVGHDFLRRPVYNTATVIGGVLMFKMLSDLHSQWESTRRWQAEQHDRCEMNAGASNIQEQEEGNLQ